MKTLLRHHHHPIAKFSVPIAGLIFIFVAFTLLNSPFLFTYRSRANEDVVNTQATEQSSVLSVQLHELPLCVSSFSYIPISEKSLQSCFVQFTCVDPAGEVYFTSPHYSCSQQQLGFTCSENESKEKCTFVDEWLKGAAMTCGCSEELSS